MSSFKRTPSSKTEAKASSAPAASVAEIEDNIAAIEVPLSLEVKTEPAALEVKSKPVGKMTTFEVIDKASAKLLKYAQELALKYKSNGEFEASYKMLSSMPAREKIVLARQILVPRVKVLREYMLESIRESLLDKGDFDAVSKDELLDKIVTALEIIAISAST